MYVCRCIPYTIQVYKTANLGISLTGFGDVGSHGAGLGSRLVMRMQVSR